MLRGSENLATYIGREYLCGVNGTKTGAGCSEHLGSIRRAARQAAYPQGRGASLSTAL
jgi:hypothetical protein